MANILYLSYDGLNDPLGKSQILPYLEGLADLGHTITVVGFEKGKKPEGSARQTSGKLTTVHLTYHKWPPVLSTLYDLYLLRRLVTKMLNAPVRHATAASQIDIVHCRSYVTALIGLWARRRFGVQFVFDMRGFWPDERVEGGVWNLKNPLFAMIYRYFKRKEKELISEADAVISLTRNAKKEICTWNFSDVSPKEMLSSDKISVIPTCADLDLFSADQVSISRQCQLRKSLGIEENDRILLYLGSLGTWYMLDEMLDFFEVLKVNSGFRFLFVTKDREVLNRALANRHYQPGEVILTSCDRQQVPSFISICHAAIFFIIPTFSKKASAATKMGEIMAMGKPVITNSGWGDVDEIIDGENGILIENLETRYYQKSIARIPLQTDPSKIRQTAIQHFSLQQGILDFNRIYERLRNDL
ncbi:MAG: glycosyltransferase family 4 protein [Cyclobacteriaceae bacterium]|nr:glycosyltransferase family 4 protein [Cyclobacteriaceae bacterium]